MAEQRVSNERKKELEQLDPFQENLIKGLHFLKEHQKQVVLAITAVLSVIIVFSGVMYSLKKSEEKAALLLNKATAEYVTAGENEEGYLAVKAMFETLFNDYANTTAGKQAKITFAKICYDAAKYDESFQYYKQALDTYEDQALLENFLLAALGHVSIAKNELKAAMSFFEQIAASDSDLLKDEASYALAMLTEQTGNLEDSKKHYEKIVSDFTGSIYAPLAKSKLAALE